MPICTSLNVNLVYLWKPIAWYKGEVMNTNSNYTFKNPIKVLSIFQAMIFHFTQLCFLAVLVSAHQEKELDIPYDSSTSTLQNDEVCWERCFQVEDTEYER